MAIDLLVKPGTALENLFTGRLRDAGTVVVDPQAIVLRLFFDAQLHFAVRPFAGVVQQVAQQLQQVLTVPRQEQTRRHVLAQFQAFAMNHAQGR
ncbi:hypothetical protein D9M71_613550 [compost metagenome]